MNSKRFDYANGCFQVFPVSFERRYNGIGTIIKEKEYILYFPPETPTYLITRVAKDYAEYYENKKSQEEKGIFID